MPGAVAEGVCRMFVQRRRDGFTLIELLVVVSIIAVLIAVMLPALQMARAAAHVAQCASNLKQVGIALVLYEEDFQMFPTGPFNRPNYSWGWAVNATAVGNPNNTYWGDVNCNNGGFGFYCNPYCNLPATNASNPGTEVFELFHCPGDQQRLYNPDYPGCPLPGWPAEPMGLFEWQGTSYHWNSMYYSHLTGCTLPGPLDFSNGPHTTIPWEDRALIWRKMSHVKRPDIQVLVGDAPKYPDYAGLIWTGFADCHDFMFNNHGVEEPWMNIGFVDGHVKFFLAQDAPNHYSNADYSYWYLSE